MKKDKPREFTEDMRLIFQKEKLMKYNNFVLIALVEMGVRTTREDPLQRIVRNLIHKEFAYEKAFFLKVDRLAKSLKSEHNCMIQKKRLLELINQSRRAKGKPTYLKPSKPGPKLADGIDRNSQIKIEFDSE